MRRVTTRKNLRASRILIAPALRIYNETRANFRAQPEALLPA
jgi:hypothetical protein